MDWKPPEPSIVILNLQEGQPDNPVMDTHFMINLNTQQIHDKFLDVWSIAPADCLGDLQIVCVRKSDLSRLHKIKGLETFTCRRSWNGRLYFKLVGFNYGCGCPLAWTGYPHQCGDYKQN